MPRTAQPARPRLACEVTPDRVIAARTTPAGNRMESFGARALVPGVVQPRLAAENITNAAALTRAIEEVVALVGARSRDLSVVLPDAAVRLMLLDFDSLPAKASEATPLLRFRLKKLLPFDADGTALSYQVVRTAEGARVVAAVAMAAVVEEYEAAFLAAGYHPGVVLPSLAAALGAVDAAEPTLVIKADGATTSVAIVDQQQLCLVRTLEHGKDTPPQQLADDIQPLLVFFEDTYGGRIARILVGGNLTVDAVRPLLAPLTDARLQDLVGPALFAGTSVGSSVPRGSLAGVAGALLG